MNEKASRLRHRKRRKIKSQRDGGQPRTRHVVHMCVTAKRTYKSKQKAEEELVKVSEENHRKVGQVIRTYQCEFCGMWHLSSQEKRSKV